MVNVAVRGLIFVRTIGTRSVGCLLDCWFMQNHEKKKWISRANCDLMMVNESWGGLSFVPSAETPLSIPQQPSPDLPQNLSLPSSLSRISLNKPKSPPQILVTQLPWVHWAIPFQGHQRSAPEPACQEERHLVHPQWMSYVHFPTYWEWRKEVDNHPEQDTRDEMWNVNNAKLLLRGRGLGLSP